VSRATSPDDDGSRQRERRDHEADRLKCGALLLDGWGRIVRMNQCARRYLSSKCSRCSLAECEDMYWTTAASPNCLASALNTDAPGLSLVGAPKGPRSLLVTVTDLPEDFQKLVILVDLHESLQPDADVLKRLFNLTRAEARLAVRLTSGSAPARGRGGYRSRGGDSARTVEVDPLQNRYASPSRTGCTVKPPGHHLSSRAVREPLVSILSLFA
jgi:hypothetical protein